VVCVLCSLWQNVGSCVAPIRASAAAGQRRPRRLERDGRAAGEALARLVGTRQEYVDTKGMKRVGVVYAQQQTKEGGRRRTARRGTDPYDIYYTVDAHSVGEQPAAEDSPAACVRQFLRCRGPYMMGASRAASAGGPGDTDRPLDSSAATEYAHAAQHYSAAPSISTKSGLIRVYIVVTCVQRSVAAIAHT
jgi:hypothetical protein